MPTPAKEAPQGQDQIPHYPSSMTPIGRQRPSVTRYPGLYLRLVCSGLGGAAGPETELLWEVAFLGSIKARCSECVRVVTT